MRIGIISDTHGLLRSEALAALAGSDLIVHAGDIGDRMVLVRLAQLAQVRAVRGNVDTGAWAQKLPSSELVLAEEASIYVHHGDLELDIDPAAAGVAAIVSGHTHEPALKRSGGVLFINPGSAGPKRLRLPVSVARLYVSQGKLEPELVELKIG